MIDFLLFCLSSSLAIIGLHVAACWPGMIFYDLRECLVKVNLYSPLPGWFKKPLYQCPICMSSIWTILFWTIFIRNDYLYLLLAIPVVAGTNTFLCIVLRKFTDYGCDD